MAEQKFKVGDRVKSLYDGFTATIIGISNAEVLNPIYQIAYDNGYSRLAKESMLERITSDTDNFKQTITIETERKTGEIVIRISNPIPTVDEPTVRGTIVGDMINKSSKSRITDEQKTVLEGLYLLGYRYLACDKDGAIYAFINCPEKFSRNWDDAIGYITIKVNKYNDIMNGICSWEDEKPTSIAWLLGEKDDNE